MSSHNTSIYKHKISIPILAEISALTPNRLRKIYRQIIEDDCIPLSEIPLHQQETFINEKKGINMMLTQTHLPIMETENFKNSYQ